MRTHLRLRTRLAEGGIRLMKPVASEGFRDGAWIFSEKAIFKSQRENPIRLTVRRVRMMIVGPIVLRGWTSLPLNRFVE